MSKRGKKAKAAKKHTGGKSVKFGKRVYKCRAQRVSAFGRRAKSTRVYCRRAKKA